MKADNIRLLQGILYFLPLIEKVCLQLQCMPIKAYVELTDVVSAVQDGGGESTVIVDQKDTYESSHSFTEFVEKGLHGDQRMSVTGARTIVEDTEKCDKPGSCSKKMTRLISSIIQQNFKNMNGHVVSRLTPRNISEEIIKYIFTLKSRRVVRK